jgi:hypothetical protein
MDGTAERAQTLEYLNAHVDTVHRGLQALLALLMAAPPATPLQAGQLVALLQPLACEASQAEPLTRLLLPTAGEPG